MVQAIKQAVDAAALTHQKIAMFHFQVLTNAAALEGVDPSAFCEELGVPETYKTEFGKMLALARVMREQGARVVRP